MHIYEQLSGKNSDVLYFAISSHIRSAFRRRARIIERCVSCLKLFGVDIVGYILGYERSNMNPKTYRSKSQPSMLPQRSLALFIIALPSSSLSCSFDEFTILLLGRHNKAPRSIYDHNCLYYNKNNKTMQAFFCLIASATPAVS